MGKKNLSVYLSWLLRHYRVENDEEEIKLDMDIRGWVSTEKLIQKINAGGKYQTNLEQLEQIVKTDKEGRYRLNEDRSKIKACYSHSLSWVIPELEYLEPPEFLYHGTTVEGLEKIMDSGFILKMERQAVHTRAEINKAWRSAKRWEKPAVVLKIAAKEMHQNGYVFGKTENGIWCVEKVPVEYIAEYIFEKNEERDYS